MADYQNQDTGEDSRINEAKKFLDLCNTVDSNNRAEALDDVRFCAGDQWPVDVQNSRVLESRPMFVKSATKSDSKDLASKCKA